MPGGGMETEIGRSREIRVSFRRAGPVAKSTHAGIPWLLHPPAPGSLLVV
jgi:hypothetical protein